MCPVNVNYDNERVGTIGPGYGSLNLPESDGVVSWSGDTTHILQINHGPNRIPASFTLDKAGQEAGLTIQKPLGILKDTTLMVQVEVRVKRI